MFTATPADAQALHDGSLDLSVAFMRGQVKMAGDFGALLHFLPKTSGTAPALRLADLLPAGAWIVLAPARRRRVRFPYR